jgi:nicotinamide N-methyltransferase
MCWCWRICCFGIRSMGIWSYRPWLQHKDLRFFDKAREEGFVVEKVLEKKMDRPLFEKDPGDEEILKTVTGWTLRWPEEVLGEEGK